MRRAFRPPTNTGSSVAPLPFTVRLLEVITGSALPPSDVPLVKLFIDEKTYRPLDASTMVSAWPSLFAVLTALISPVTSPLAMLKTVGTVRSSNRSNSRGTERRRLAARCAPRDNPSFAPNQRCRRDFNHIIGENS